MNNDLEITNRIQPPFMYPSDRPVQPHEKFEAFKSAQPFAVRFYDRKHNRDCLCTQENWRKILTCMVAMSYYVRECGFILTKRTFADDNMVILDENIKFKQLFGVAIQHNQEQPDTDFLAISDLVSSLAANCDLPDISTFINLLRRTGQRAPSHNEPLIRCNYALMPNSMRREFLIQLSVDYNYLYGYDKTSFDEAAYTLLPRDWRVEATCIKDSPLAEVYANAQLVKYNRTASSCIRFIRNASTHLTDLTHEYYPSDAYMVLDSYFGRFMAGLQAIIFADLLLLDSDCLWRYKPST